MAPSRCSPRIEQIKHAPIASKAVTEIGARNERHAISNEVHSAKPAITAAGKADHRPDRDVGTPQGCGAARGPVPGRQPFAG